MDELKCPCCGGKSRIIEQGYTQDALRHVQYYAKCLECGIHTLYYDTREEAAAAFNRRPAPENKPLTMDQLRQMDGEPVWIEGKDYGGWTIFKAGANKQVARCLDNVNLSYYMDDYGKTWVAYARKPEVE